MANSELVVSKSNSFCDKKLRVCLTASILVTVFSIILFCSIIEDSRYFQLRSAYFRSSLRANQLHGLNAHLWEGSCPLRLEDLCKFPIFPKAPTLRVIANTSKVIYPFTDISVRLFGFLHPPVSGSYNFSVKISSHSSFILLLSTDELPFNSRRLSRNTEQIVLEKGKKYFVDFLYNQVKLSSPNVSLTWQKPGHSTFTVIKEEFLSVYLNDSKLRTRKIHDIDIPETNVCRTKPVSRANQSNSYFKREPIDYIPHSEVMDVLPHCKYDPSYNIHDRKVRYRWEGLNDLIQYTWWYPFTNVSNEVADPKGWYFDLDQTAVEKITKLYLTKLEERHPGKYKFLSIKSVERKEDKKLGHRYLLELILLRQDDNRVQVLSEYIFKQKHNHSLCYPMGLQWNRTADIYFVVTSKNQGRWVQHLINNMARIYQEKKDQHFHLVIFDYKSQDIDIAKSLEESLLPRYTLIRRPGEFIKTKAYNEAVSSVKDPNAIIFLVDLHLEIASNLLDNIRKHCFKETSAYIPIIIRLSCGYFPEKPRGHWEGDGYGLLGVYKSDWDRFGGFTNHRKGWGGEDWDLIDNVVEKGLEMERLRTPYVYHYYHNKKGMWNK